MNDTDMDWSMRMRRSTIGRLVQNNHLLRYAHPWSLGRAGNHFIILLLLFVAAPLPGSAQTISPRLHPVSNTLWQLFPQDTFLGFADGIVYVCNEPITGCVAAEDSLYSDFVLFAVFYIPVREEHTGFMVGFLPAVGRFGRMMVYNISLRYALHFTLLLVNENWTSPE